MRKAFALAFALALVAPWARAGSSYPVQEKELIRKVLSFKDPSQPGLLSVDNVLGSIRVEAGNDGSVEITAHKTIRAESRDKVRQAKDEVKLDIVEKPEAIEIYVDGPFRCKSRDGHEGINLKDRGYEVLYDFVLKVPSRTRLIVKTVSEGDVRVKGVEGAFTARNVNGRVELVDLAGSGEAETVNGGLKASFIRNPSADCSFTTINGDIELAFKEGLAADFRLKTFNGDAFSDFETRPLPGPVVKTRKNEKGMSVYRLERFTSVRAGAGGPVLSCDTFNGDILIKKYPSGK